eukprot:CAMPEP_0172185106 /NCGR_PEP_ID=MMETSP1050-20130122/19972_1 /TAXON_ID=233186 /ORGANISM="Cryptomonas curvata, Strain CCAP979/52" /LENGTH=94 /DNA_ID=CAMNT_0012859029 /DNA_START=405 /DNA_END=689 /DNA_ORIENTATION=+
MHCHLDMLSGNDDMFSAADTPNAHFVENSAARNMPVCLERTGGHKSKKTVMDTIASGQGAESWSCMDFSGLARREAPLSLRRQAGLAGTTPFYG